MYANNKVAFTEESMKKFKRFLCAILAFVLIITALPFAVSVSAETEVYSSKLTDLEQKIYSGYKNMDKTIYVYSYSATYNEVAAAIENVFNKRPDIFYVSKSKTCSIAADGYVTTITPGYLFTADEVEAAKTTINASVNALIGDLDSNMADVQKLILLHDRMILDFVYNDEGIANDSLTDNDYTIYGVLVNKSGICEAYAKAFKYCADLLGIENEIVPFSAMNHIWNQVKVNGNWYNIDVTNDDIGSSGLFSHVSHNHFLFSDTAALKKGYKEGYNTNSATDTTYDSGAFWQNSLSSVFMAGDVFVYSLKNGKICTYDFNTNTSTTLVSLTSSDRWKMPNSSSSYAVYFIRPFYYNGYIYYNLPKSICTIRPDGTGKSIIYTYSVDDRQIFGLGYDNDVPSFTVRTGPYNDDSIIPLSQTSKVLKAINLTANPSKTIYMKGETLDTEGMVVTALYNDGSTFDLIETDYTIAGFDSKTVGKKSLVISYGSKTCPLELSVVDYGDIDMDYAYTSADLLKLQQHFFEINVLSNMEFKLADIDSDSVLDATDILMLQTKILSFF